jgi:hypothetical protein
MHKKLDLSCWIVVIKQISLINIVFTFTTHGVLGFWDWCNAFPHPKYGSFLPHKKPLSQHKIPVTASEIRIRFSLALIRILFILIKITSS